MTKSPARTPIRRFAGALLAVVRYTWLVMGIVLVLMIALEVVARWWLGRTRIPHELRAAAVRALPAAGEAEQNALAREFVGSQAGYFEQIPIRWSPYTYWRARPYDGQYIKINADGVRRSVCPVSQQVATPQTLAFFGGSTIYGDMVPDDQTIPSCVWRSLRLPEQFQVVNFGQLGYVSTQEVTTLALECRAGRVPRAVVMYSGFNDSLSAYQNVQAGLTMSENNRRREFGSYTNPATTDVLQELIESLALYKIFSPRNYILIEGQITKDAWINHIEQLQNDPRFRAEYLARRSAAGSFDQEQKSKVIVEIATRYVAEETIRAYAFNLRTLKALQAHYGFAALIYWQPTLWTKASPSAEEQGYLREFDERGERAFVLQVLQTLRAKMATAAANREFAVLQDVIDLSDALDGVGNTHVYIDPCHLNGRGNAAVATRIARDIEAALAPQDANVGP
ncbi:MAG: hypothetical protein K2Y37_07810 [Pirellulales bacterium]|nr:hypothetical protein [Pirellulales bacterium]